MEFREARNLLDDALRIEDQGRRFETVAEVINQLPFAAVWLEEFCVLDDIDLMTYLINNSGVNFERFMVFDRLPPEVRSYLIAYKPTVMLTIPAEEWTAEDRKSFVAACYNIVKLAQIDSLGESQDSSYITQAYGLLQHITATDTEDMDVATAKVILTMLPNQSKLIPEGLITEDIWLALLNDNVELAASIDDREFTPAIVDAIFKHAAEPLRLIPTSKLEPRHYVQLIDLQGPTNVRVPSDMWTDEVWELMFKYDIPIQLYPQSALTADRVIQMLETELCPIELFKAMHVRNINSELIRWVLGNQPSSMRHVLAYSSVIDNFSDTDLEGWLNINPMAFCYFPKARKSVGLSLAAIEKDPELITQVPYAIRMDDVFCDQVESESLSIEHLNFYNQKTIVQKLSVDQISLLALDQLVCLPSKLFDRAEVIEWMSKHPLSGVIYSTIKVLTK